MKTRLALTAALVLTACGGPSEADKAAIALGYAIAPSGGAPVTGVFDLGAGIWSFKATIPEGWRWRKRAPKEGEPGDFDGVEIMSPNATQAQLQKGPDPASDTASCAAQIEFKSFRTASESEETQDQINQRIRNRAATSRIADRRGSFQPEVLEAGAYTGLHYLRTHQREYERDKYVLDLLVGTEWETPDLFVTSTCGITLAADADWTGDAIIADMTAFTRSTVIVPPPGK